MRYGRRQGIGLRAYCPPTAVLGTLLSVYSVKDHPRINDGHKTRFWCSQDEAHRNKVKGARAAAGDIPKPRVTSSGDLMAKARYPCRSRLLISSRDSERTGTRIVTVRLAHHVKHEPYIDASLPAEVAKTICESFGWFGNQSGVDTGSSAGSSSARDEDDRHGAVGNGEPQLSVSPSQLHDPSQPDGNLFGEMDYDDNDEEMGQGEDEPQHFGPSALVEEQANQINQSQRSSGPTTSSASDYVPDPPPPIPPPIPPDIYQRRMQAMIANIREFCNGLEYQLQFQDTRMLEVVEKEGAGFLKLVEDCLRTENRLVSVPSEPITLGATALGARGGFPSSSSGLGAVSPGTRR